MRYASEAAGSRSPAVFPKRLLLAPLRVSEHRQVLMGLDLVAVNSALLLSLTLRPRFEPGGGVLITHPLWFALLSSLWLLLAHAFDAYEPRVTAQLQSGMLAVAKAGALTSGIYLLLPYVTPPLPPSRLPLLSFSALMISALLAARTVYTLVLPTPAFRRRALIVGSGRDARTITRVILEHGCSNYEVVGVMRDSGADDGNPTNGRAAPFGTTREARGGREGAWAGRTGAGLLRRGRPGRRRRSAEDLAARYGATTLVLCRDHPLDSVLLQSLISCAERGIEVIPMATLYEELTGRVLVQRVGDQWYGGLPTYPPGVSVLWNLAKRLMDLILAALGLACLGPILPLIALAIYLDSHGPIFYTQERVGKGGTIFRIYKFRSMVPNAEKGKARWAADHDRRITRVGRILRTTHLDECPQFLNVLKGDMSFVGPRPERPEWTEKLAAAIPFYRLRHSVRPGMGGWGLVRQGYAGTTHDALMRLQYDLYYIKHQSLALDTLIMLKTLGHALAFRGR